MTGVWLTRGRAARAQNMLLLGQVLIEKNKEAIEKNKAGDFTTQNIDELEQGTARSAGLQGMRMG